MVLKAFKLYPEVRTPQRATEQAACFDLCAYLGQPVFDVEGFFENNKPCKAEIFDNVSSRHLVIDPGQRLLIPTGIIFDIPEGYSVRLHPRSGLALKEGLVMANCQGIIDSDYVHETKIMVLNTSTQRLQIYHGDRIAQGELVKVENYSITETVTKPETKTNRTGGFGSTGV